MRWSVTVRSDARLWEIDAAVSGGLEGFRFVADEVAAMPGQQIGDTVDRMCCDALEEVAQIGFRLDIVEPRSCDQGSDGCSAHATCVGSRKQPVFPTQGDRPDRAFDGVVVDLDGAVIGVACQCRPAGERVTECGREITALRNAPQRCLQPSLYVREQRPGSRLAAWRRSLGGRPRISPSIA